MPSMTLPIAAEPEKPAAAPATQPRFGATLGAGSIKSLTVSGADPEPDRPRRFAVVDTETTALDGPARIPVEIAVILLAESTGGHLDVEEQWSFVPFHTQEQIGRAEPEALTINRYYERCLYKEILPTSQDRALARRLRAELTDATLVAANPAFDAAVLRHWIGGAGLRQPTAGETFEVSVSGNTLAPAPVAPWRFRLYDVEVATAALHGLTKIPGLSECARLWNVPVDPELAHTALGDALVATEVFRRIVAAGATVGFAS